MNILSARRCFPIIRNSRPRRHPIKATKTTKGLASTRAGSLAQVSTTILTR